MTQTNILELAKQGDPRAIAALLTRQLQSQGTSVKAALKDGCLQLMLESEQVPEQQDVMEIVRDGITGLDTESIQKVKVYGRQTGDKSPTWAQEFDVEPKAEFPSFSFGSDADEPNDYQNNYHEEDVVSSINEEEPEFSYEDENKSSSGKGVKFAPVAGGLQSLKTAPSKVKLMAVGGLATLLIAGGAIYKFTSGGEEAATETPPTPVAVAKPATTAPKDTKAKPAAAKPQPSATAAKAKSVAATPAKPQPSPTAAAKAKPVAATPTKPQPSPTTAAKPAPVAAANSQANAMQQAVNKAETAAKLVQSAKSKQQWKAVAAEWQEAIALMKSVPKTHPKYQLAQQRIGQYQQFLAYAQQNSKR